jgi:hypothetical protein
MQLKTAISVAAAAAVFVLTSGCSNRVSVQRTLDQSIHTTDNSPKILADYQPWFGDTNHIKVGYSTQDPKTLQRQINEAKNMGIYAFAVDWYGDRQPFLDRSYALLQQVASQNNFHVCLMYDETQEDNGHATDDALEAFEKAYNEYIGPTAPARNAYVTYQGRPLIFIFPKRGNTDWDRVRQAVNSWDQPPILIYKDKPPAKYAADFDGFYPWVHPGPKGWNSNGQDWGKDYLQTFYRNTRNNFPHKMIIGTAWPGFDDTRASWSLNRHIDRRCGKTFEDTLDIFHQNDDPSRPMPFLLIATWNDYEEGTQIEDGVAHCRPGDRRENSAGQ